MLLAAMKTPQTRIAFFAVLLFSLATIVLLGPAETAQLESVQLQATPRLIEGAGYANNAMRVTLAGQDSRTTVSMTPTGRSATENGL